MDLDRAFGSIGDHGRGQILVFTIICSITQIPASWHIFAILFLGATPDHICTEHAAGHVGTPGGISFENVTEYEACGYGVRNGSCDSGWVYSRAVYRSTVVTEWDLVCDRASFVELSQTVLMIGVMVGSFTIGYLADRFGRKKILFAGLFVQGIVGILQALSPSVFVFIFIRFFIGILDQSYELPAYSMVSELFTPRCRPYAFISLMNFWAAGIFTLPCLAYFIRDWRYLQFAISVPFLFFPLFYWVVPESPRWLLSVGRYEEASKVVNGIARLNGKKSTNIVFSDPKSSQKLLQSTREKNLGPGGDGDRFPDGTHETQNEKQSSDMRLSQNEMEQMNPTDAAKDGDVQRERSSNSYSQLFRGYHMSLVTIVMATLWFVAAFSYYGLSLNAGRLVGDPYLNVFLSGFVEIPSHILATMIVVWFGRRWPICITLLTTFIACIGVACIPRTTETGVDLTVAIVATAAAGKFSVAISYAITCLYATEVFPTILRNKGIALVAITARVGAMIAPFVLLLDVYLPNAPMILFGSVALVPGMFVLLLPEMKGRHQPQTIADLELLFEEDRQRKQSLKADRRRGQSRDVPPTENVAFETGNADEKAS